MSRKQVKILAIGNSFSECAFNYLNQIGKAGNTDFLLGNLFIGGCLLERHWANAEQDADAYSYQKTEFDGTRHDRPETSMAYALRDEDWDIISIQQGSSKSGIADSYFPYIQQIIDYAKQICPGAKWVIHETWAYAKDSTHSAFEQFGCDQETMYKAVVHAYHAASEKTGVKTIIPCGEVWQAVRGTEIGDTITKDGYHGNEKGDFAAGAAWYEKITGENILENRYIPEGVTEQDAAVIKQCVHDYINGN